MYLNPPCKLLLPFPLSFKNDAAYSLVFINLSFLRLFRKCYKTNLKEKFKARIDFIFIFNIRFGQSFRISDRSFLFVRESNSRRRVIGPKLSQQSEKCIGKLSNSLHRLLQKTRKSSLFRTRARAHTHISEISQLKKRTIVPRGKKSRNLLPRTFSKIFSALQQRRERSTNKVA